MIIYMVNIFAIIGVVSIYVLVAAITREFADHIFNDVLECKATSPVANTEVLCATLWPLFLPILVLFFLFR